MISPFLNQSTVEVSTNSSLSFFKETSLGPPSYCVLVLPASPVFFRAFVSRSDGPEAYDDTGNRRLDDDDDEPPTPVVRARVLVIWLVRLER